MSASVVPPSSPKPALHSSFASRSWGGCAQPPSAAPGPTAGQALSGCSNGWSPLERFSAAGSGVTLRGRRQARYAQVCAVLTGGLVVAIAWLGGVGAPRARCRPSAARRTHGGVSAWTPVTVGAAGAWVSRALSAGGDAAVPAAGAVVPPGFGEVELVLGGGVDGPSVLRVASGLLAMAAGTWGAGAASRKGVKLGGLGLSCGGPLVALRGAGTAGTGGESSSGPTQMLSHPQTTTAAAAGHMLRMCARSAAGGASPCAARVVWTCSAPGLLCGTRLRPWQRRIAWDARCARLAAAHGCLSVEACERAVQAAGEVPSGAVPFGAVACFAAWLLAPRPLQGCTRLLCVCGCGAEGQEWALGRTSSGAGFPPHEQPQLQPSTP
jgi:hypothetical protein